MQSNLAADIEAILAGRPPSSRARRAPLPRHNPRPISTLPTGTAAELRQQIAELEEALRRRCGVDIVNRESNRATIFTSALPADRLADALHRCRDRLAILEANPPPPPPRKVELPNN